LHRGLFLVLNCCEAEAICELVAMVSALDKRNIDRTRDGYFSPDGKRTVNHEM
jgi:hypothetical protein